MTCRHARATALAVFLIALGVGRVAGAGAIATSYTPTNLGPDASIGTDAAGNRIIIASDGRRYAFPGADPTAYPADALTKLGAPLPAYDNSNGPNSSILQPTGGISNGLGAFVAATYSFGRYTDMNSWSELYSFRQQPDGSFTPATVLTRQWQAAGFEFDTPMTPIDINKNGLVLFSQATRGPRGYSLYDLNSGTSTTLPIGFDYATYQTPAFQGLSLDAAVKIDDDGRVLFDADRQVAGKSEDDLVLMTPTGLSADPIATPEPSTLLVFGVAAAARLARRRHPLGWG